VRLVQHCLQLAIEFMRQRRLQDLAMELAQMLEHLRMFHMCWALSDGSSKLIPIDEQPNHQIVHLFRLGSTH
jgi:hypothetical protein